jgi:1,4-alpha-glucan branching enzyme
MATTLDGIDRATPLGATLRPDGVAFRVWAPAAVEMYVLTGDALARLGEPDFSPSPDDGLAPLGDGTWGAFVPGLGEGAPYRFWVVGTGSRGPKRDPRARELSQAPPYPECDCLVRSPATYPWHDAGFRPPAFRDLLLYQLHVGVFYGVDAQGRDRRAGVARFLDLLDRIDYLKELGINAVQLLPVQEFPSETSEGYNGLDLYSPETDYHVADPAELDRYLAQANARLAAHGEAPLTREQLLPGPNQLRCAIDLLHLEGIAVLFDLVFNHAGPGWNEESLWFFDREPPGDDNRSLYFTDADWVGGRVFAYWKADVRQFLVDNALEALAEYHADGFRYDEVSVIDDHGGGAFCQELSAAVRAARPEAIQIAEYWKADRAAALRPAPLGLGFDAAWSDRLRDAVRAAMAQAAGGASATVDLAALAEAFETPPGFDPWQPVHCLENHDLVYVGHDPTLPRLAALCDPGDPRSWYARSRARAATGLLLAARGIPMLFMGQEILEEKPWSDDAHDRHDLLLAWDRLDGDQAMRDHLRFCRDLLALRRAEPALRGDSLRVSVANSYNRVFAVHRWLEGEGRDLLFVWSLGEASRRGYRIGFPGTGRFREIFNSDVYDRFPNPSPTGNDGAVEAWGPPWDGMPASAEIAIPANGFVVFAR